MNCKPGDLAVIVGFNPMVPEISGRIVEVLAAAPAGHDFRLPDGTTNVAAGPGFWIVKFQNPVSVPMDSGRSRMALFGSCPDSRLRPLRDDPGADETLTWAGLPAPLTTPAPEPATT